MPHCPAGQPSLTNKHLLEEGLGSVLLALSVVMAGSGHLPTLKLLRGGCRGARVGAGGEAAATRRCSGCAIAVGMCAGQSHNAPAC